MPGQQVAHQLAAGPAVGARDRDGELVVGQIGEGLERPEGVALLIEEFACVEVHACMLAAATRPMAS